MAIPAPAIRPTGAPRERDRTRLTDRLAPHRIRTVSCYILWLIHPEVLLIYKCSYFTRVGREVARRGAARRLLALSRLHYRIERKENLIPPGSPEEFP